MSRTKPYAYFAEQEKEALRFVRINYCSWILDVEKHIYVVSTKYVNKKTLRKMAPEIINKYCGSEIGF